VSKLRDKLAALISQQFFDQEQKLVNVDGDDLIPAEGWYRTSMQADCYRWEGSCEWLFEGGRITVMLYGSDTMTEMVKSGVILTKDRETSYDVHAKSD
jgi:hypothetical protein